MNMENYRSQFYKHSNDFFICLFCFCSMEDIFVYRGKFSAPVLPRLIHRAFYLTGTQTQIHTCFGHFEIWLKTFDPLEGH